MLRVLPFFMNRHDAALAHVSNGAKWKIVVGVWNVNRRMLLGKDQATSQQSDRSNSKPMPPVACFCILRASCARLSRFNDLHCALFTPRYPALVKRGYVDHGAPSRGRREE